MTAKQTDPDVEHTPFPADADPVVLGGRTCDRVLGLLDEFLAGALPEVDRAGVDHHLSVCKPCRTAADEYFEVVRLAGSLAPIRPSPEVEARLRRLIGRMLGQSRIGDG